MNRAPRLARLVEGGTATGMAGAPRWSREVALTFDEALGR
jgi:hypothetical protein